MNTLKSITDKIFASDKDIGGLSVSVDDLANMKKYARYFNMKKDNKNFSVLSGDVKSVFKGRGLEFEEIRAYSFGDDIRDMDWRVTARKDEPYIKVFHEEKDREIYVLLDLSASMVFGTKKELKSVSAAKMAALIGWAALENKDRFGCVIYDGTDSYIFRAKGGLKNLLAIFQQISEFSHKILQNPQKGSLEKPLKMLEKNIKSRGNIFLISDFAEFDDKVKDAVFALSKKSEICMLQISDRIELVAPKSGEYMAEYAGTKVVFDTFSDEFKDVYAEYFAKKRENIKNFAAKIKSKYIVLKNEDDVLRQIKSK